MKRVLVIGCGGAGKSTLARRMGKVLGLPVIFLDKHFWKPGWVETPQGEWVEILKRLVARDAWIMDGSYTATLEMRATAADTIVFVDTARWRCIVRALRRVLRYRGKTRPDLPEGCPEGFDWQFLMWIWSYRKRSRPKILGLRDQTGNTHRWEVLAHPRDIEPFLTSLRVAP